MVSPSFGCRRPSWDREVEYVKTLGVDIQLNMVVGKAHTVEALMADGYKAVFIAGGRGRADVPEHSGRESERRVFGQ